MKKLSKLIKRFTDDEVFRLIALRSLVGLLIKVFAAVLSLLMFIAIARVTTTDDYGRFGFIFSLATLLAVLGGVGQRMFSLRQSSVYSKAGDIPKLKGVFLWGLGLTLCGCLAVSAGAYLLGLLFEPLALKELLIPTLLLCFALGLAEFLTHFFRGYRSIPFALVPRDLLWRFGVIGVCVCAYFLGTTLSALEAILALALTLLTILAIQLICDPTTRKILLRWSSPAFQIKEWWGKSYKLWLVSIIQTIGGPVLAPVLLGLILAPSETGPLFAALRIALALELFTMAAGMAIAPSIAQLISLNNLQNLQKILTQSVASVSLPTFMVFGAVVWLGPNILAFMNPDFTSAYGALVVLTFGYLVSVCTGPVIQFMELTGREDYLMKLLAACNILCLGLYVLLIYFYGTLGAAVAATTLRVTVHLILARHIIRSVGVDPTILSMFGTRK